MGLAPTALVIQSPQGSADGSSFGTSSHPKKTKRSESADLMASMSAGSENRESVVVLVSVVVWAASPWPPPRLAVTCATRCCPWSAWVSWYCALVAPGTAWQEPNLAGSLL